MMVNGEMQVARFSFPAFRFTEQQNQTVSTYYLHCITRLCEISTCSAFRVKTFKLLFRFHIVLELVNFTLIWAKPRSIRNTFWLGMGTLFFSVIVHIQWFCQALLFWGNFWTKQEKATYTLSSPRHFLDSSRSMALSTAMWQTKKERRCVFDHHPSSKWSHRIQNYHITSHCHTCR